jgi:hypothetical protein
MTGPSARAHRGEHGVVDALDQLTADTSGHDLVTRADDDDFGDIDDDAKVCFPRQG